MLPGLTMVMRQADLVSALSVVTIPSGNISKTISSSDGLSHTVTSAAVTAIPSGGSGSYTYAWTQVFGDGSISATAASSAATAFTASLAPDVFENATFRCTVTDTVTGGHATVDIDVDLQHVDLR